MWWNIFELYMEIRSAYKSKISAGERYRDVFVDIDVFGRGFFCSDGFNTCEVC